VRAIAEGRGGPIPSFLGRMAWSSLILLPILAAISCLFFS
jgi:Putative citrate transport